LGSHALFQPRLRCSLSRFVMVIVRVRALAIKLSSPVRFVTHSIPGMEHIDKNDDGPEKS
jgi:hypothetical protein